MPSWRGNINNPAPNPVKESINRSEKRVGDDRSQHVRRDTDKQKNITIGFYDIDETILNHLNRLNLQVKDGGEMIKVPITYGSPEIWTSATTHGYLRDNQGKLILPIIAFKRTTSENDVSLQYFNRYLNSSVLKKYSTKNKYTKFSLLTGQNAPINEVYNIIFPSHMVMNYHFIVWTEYVEQMNSLIENIQFNTKDYWGNKDGFKFRTRIDSYAHTTELQVGDDRLVKTEFDLTTHGYILPETITNLENQKLTIDKVLTPKKIVVGTEVVSTDFDMNSVKPNDEKWKNSIFPNLPKSEIIDPPGISVSDDLTDSTIASTILSTLKSLTSGTPLTITTDSTSNSSNTLKIVSAPVSTTSAGTEGQISYDERYFYLYSGGSWRRVPISQFS